MSTPKFFCVDENGKHKEVDFNEVTREEALGFIQILTDQLQYEIKENGKRKKHFDWLAFAVGVLFSPVFLYLLGLAYSFTK